MRFDTPLTLTGPFRSPQQLLAEQTYDGHVSVHDEAAAATLGLAGAPIEGPTHLSQFDPFGVALWGKRWFTHGCISAHFQTMVVEGEEVQAAAELDAASTSRAAVRAVKRDGTPVLSGSISVGPEHPPTELDRRLGALGDPGELFVIDRVRIGDRRDDEQPQRIAFDERNGELYPFSLQRKLDTITEPHPWYTRDAGGASPWGGAVLPMEMLSVLTQKAGPAWPVRSPALGLFLDLEVRMLAGPVLAEHDYLIRREVRGRSQSRRVESYWTRSEVVEPADGTVVCAVVLHQGVFKESYPGYPKG